MPLAGRCADHGYTLIEALAALAIISLALGGLTVAVTTTAHGQARIGARIAQANALRAGEVGLERALQAGGAYRARDPASFRGDAKGFNFECRAGGCRVDLAETRSGLALSLTEGARVRSLPLRTAGPAHFVYQGVEATGAWPPSGDAKPPLRAVLLVRDDGQDTPILAAKVWRDQPADCAFDVVMQDCR